MAKKKITAVDSQEELSLKLDSIKPLPQSEPAIPVADPAADTAVDAPKGIEYEDRVVAFVDVLGFKEIIQRSANNPELVKRIFYALDVRKDDWATMYAKEVGLDHPPEYFDDRFHSFSDCIVMSVGTRIEDIGLLIYGVFKVCRQLLGQGFASRGGIAMGKLYHHDDGQSSAVMSRAPSMVFGPAFIDAYQFESSHADGPRVILQNGVWKKITEYCDANRTEKLSKFLRVHVPRADDGPAFIDLFADFGINSFYESERDLSTEMHQIKEHICAALDSTTDKPHFFKKNAQLAREFNKAINAADRPQFQIPRDKLPQRHS
jgi:hypothetical protein